MLLFDSIPAALSQSHCMVNIEVLDHKKRYFIYQSITHQSSFILFWRMVPVRPMRTLHFNDFMVWVIWAFGFLILCASSTITADHAILQINKKYFINWNYLFPHPTYTLKVKSDTQVAVIIIRLCYFFIFLFYIVLYYSVSSYSV